MTTGKLGLPFEYQVSPEYFDTYNISDDTDAKNSVIEKILKEHAVKTVLDLTCGTGSQVFYLSKHGLKVVGADISSALIEIAKKKAVKEKIKTKFIHGDMRTIREGQFDAVISIFNAVGHLSKSDFLKAIKNISHNLNDGGIYVFDILNLEIMTDEQVAKLAWHIQKKVGDMSIHGIQCSTIDREQGRLNCFDHVVLQNNAEKPELKKYKFSLQLYTAKELKEMLDQCGFKTIAQYGLDGSKFNNKKTMNILTVAKKC
jgi:ubiquinone/menaquinone biosynthesis C-methylase UbiE